MTRIARLLRAPGARHDVEVAAPTQQVIVEAVKAVQAEENDCKEVEKEAIAIFTAVNENTYIVPSKSWFLDRWLDTIVEWSGSRLVFFLIILGLLTWAFLGIIFSRFTDWQVGISDGQAVINLIFDSFLMRQQFNAHERTLDVLGVLKSRSISNKRMLREIVNTERRRRVEEGERQHVANANPDKTVVLDDEKPSNFVSSDNSVTQHVQEIPAADKFQDGFQDFAASLPPEKLFGRICTTVSMIMGHIFTVSLFWTGIVTWISFGANLGWSSEWLLYINSATSALMVFVLAFLANIRERHGEYSNCCLEAIWKVDAGLELQLRTDTGDTLPNPTATIPRPKAGRIQRVIDYYADLVGALVGIAILILTIIIWVVLGPAMHFSSNWWLLIGTYAGLVGMNDGFVLRNVFHKLCGYENDLFAEVAWEDQDALDLLDSLNILSTEESPPKAPQKICNYPVSKAETTTTSPSSEPTRPKPKSLTERISIRMGAICSHEYTVLVGFATIICLIIGASAMQWSLAGQLLCNVPPSIIESFFMLILITGHNLGDQRRRGDLAEVHGRRLRLLRGVRRVVGGGLE